MKKEAEHKDNWEKRGVRVIIHSALGKQNYCHGLKKQNQHLFRGLRKMLEQLIYVQILSQKMRQEIRMWIVTKTESRNLADKYDGSQDTILSSLSFQLQWWCMAVCRLREKKYNANPFFICICCSCICPVVLHVSPYLCFHEKCLEVLKPTLSLENFKTQC